MPFVSDLVTVTVALFCIIVGSVRCLNSKCLPLMLAGSSEVSLKMIICVPFLSSVALLVLYFFSQSTQLILIIPILFASFLSMTYCLWPIMSTVTGMCRPEISRVASHLLSALGAIGVTAGWILTGHWLFINLLGVCLAITSIALVRLPSLRICTALLTLLVLYDVFWVFISSSIFAENVMLSVATKMIDNPLANLASTFYPTARHNLPRLQMPGTLLIPDSFANLRSLQGLAPVSHESRQRQRAQPVKVARMFESRFSIFGLGDIVMPGLLLGFLLRYDWFAAVARAASAAPDSEALLECNAAEARPPVARSRCGWLCWPAYFRTGLVGYVAGLFLASFCSEYSRTAQPALLYLVPLTILPISLRAVRRNEFRDLWTGKFAIKKLSIPLL